MRLKGNFVKGIEIDGFDFTFVEEPELGVLISDNHPVTDPNFIAALGKAKGFLESIRLYFTIDDMRYMWKEYSSGKDPDTRIGILKLIRQYESRNELSVPEWMSSFRESVENFSPDRQVYEKKKPAPKSGYVYLIKSSSGAYKIGFTGNPEERIKNFSVNLPFEVEYECLIKTDNMIKLERDLHEKFKDKRVNGEWFNLTDSDVEYLKGLAS